MRKKKIVSRRSVNKNSHIETRDVGDFVITGVQRRDEDSMLVNVITSKYGYGAQIVYIQNMSNSNSESDSAIKLTGREARTLYRTLKRHYEETGRTT